MKTPYGSLKYCWLVPDLFLLCYWISLGTVIVAIDVGAFAVLQMLSHRRLSAKLFGAIRTQMFDPHMHDHHVLLQAGFTDELLWALITLQNL